MWCREEFWGRNSNAVVKLLNEKVAYILALVEIGEEGNNLGIEVEHAVNLLQDLGYLYVVFLQMTNLKSNTTFATS